MNIELRKNVEGYTDPTAAATLNRQESGDIWEYNGARCLIIKNHGRLSTILQLTGTDHPNNVKIMTESGPAYTNPQLLTYGLHVKMARYIETVSVEDFEEVIRRTEDALGVNLQTVKNPVATELREQLDRALVTIEAQRETLEEKDVLIQGLERELIAEQCHVGSAVEKAVDRAAAEATKARNQLELLREMYNELLTKAVGGGLVSNGQE
jgi:hypothetical protein